jgi:hypothetical protein
MIDRARHHGAQRDGTASVVLGGGRRDLTAR